MRRLIPVSSKVLSIMAYLLLGIAIAWIGRQVSCGFVVTTLGAPWLGLPSSLHSVLEALGLGVPFPYGPAGTLLCAGLGLPGAIRVATRSAGPWRNARIAAGAMLVGGVLAASYRFTALVTCTVCLGLLLCGVWRRTGFWASGVLVMVLCVLPIDLTLRARPGPPRAVPTTSGCLTMESGRLDGLGELAIVGGVDSGFFEPRWVFVW